MFQEFLSLSAFAHSPDNETEFCGMNSSVRNCIFLFSA